MSATKNLIDTIIDTLDANGNDVTAAALELGIPVHVVETAIVLAKEEEISEEMDMDDEDEFLERVE